MPRLFLVVAISLLLAGCGKSAPETAATKPGDTPKLQAVSLALNWFPEAEHGGFYAALVHGYYEEAGLDVKILSGGPNSQVVPQVAKGSVMFGVSNADNVLFGRAQQADVVAVMAPLQLSPRCIMVHESSGIKSFDDLKDVTLAMNGNLAFARYLQKKFPLDGVQIVPYSGNISKFLLDKNFAQQAYNFSEPFLAKKGGGDPKNLMVSDLGFNPYTSLLIASEKTVNENSQLVEKMTAASVRGWSKYLESPDETNARIHQENPEMKLDILEFGAAALKPLVLDDVAQAQGIGTMTLERWKTLVEQLVETDQLKPDSVDPAQAFTTQFLKTGP